nr:adenylate/guanylate cyclase domain-containing protein [Serinibacter arcticus]
MSREPSNASLPPDPAPFSRVVEVASAGSTSSDLVAAVLADDDAWPHLSVLRADHQVAGRGRAGRAWHTPPGSALTASIVLRPGRSPQEWATLSLVAGLAVVTALRELAAERAVALAPALKWPNDVLLRPPGATTDRDTTDTDTDTPAVAGWGTTRKVAGLLAEIVPGRDALVLGIGVNVAQTPEHLPVPWATSLALAGLRTTSAELLDRIGAALAPLLDRWETTGFDGVRADVAEVTDTLGRDVEADLGGRPRSWAGPRRSTAQVASCSPRPTARTTPSRPATSCTRGAGERLPGSPCRPPRPRAETGPGRVGSRDVDHSDGRGNEREQDLTLERQTRLLLGDLPDMDAYDVARLVGTSAARVLQFWRSLGFAGIAANEKAFTRSDADALRAALSLIEDSGLTETAWRAVVRAAAHSADRLALWQLETLVEDAERRWVLDDTSARLVVLDTVGESVAALEALTSHAWRRHLLALLTRTEQSVGQAGTADDADALPLERATGFVDVVAYTERSAQLGAVGLAELVASFEERARDVVTASGARVVKTMGDGVLFVADDLPTGIEVALDLVDSYADAPVPLEVHGAVTWGRVLSRSGDVFGPTVNLAARLSDIAQAGQILTDEITWALAEADSGIRAGVAALSLPTAQVPGIGPVEPVLLGRVEH